MSVWHRLTLRKSRPTHRKLAWRGKSFSRRDPLTRLSKLSPNPSILTSSISFSNPVLKRGHNSKRLPLRQESISKFQFSLRLQLLQGKTLCHFHWAKNSWGNSKSLETASSSSSNTRTYASSARYRWSNSSKWFSIVRTQASLLTGQFTI